MGWLGPTGPVKTGQTYQVTGSDGVGWVGIGLCLGLGAAAHTGVVGGCVG